MTTISFSNTIEIERPAGEVYTYLADLEHVPDWNWAISETMKMTPGPVTVGTRFLQSRRVPAPATEVLEVIDLDPGRRIEVQGTLADFPVDLVYYFEPTERGTRVTNTVELDTHGKAKLLAPILGGRIKRSVAGNLARLKAQLETPERWRAS
ncbi:MAG TPA: SRPBCC family protein [Acidimicrobiia bacterium]